MSSVGQIQSMIEVELNLSCKMNALHFSGRVGERPGMCLFTCIFNSKYGYIPLQHLLKVYIYNILLTCVFIVYC